MRASKYPSLDMYSDEDDYMGEVEEVVLNPETGVSPTLEDTRIERADLSRSLSVGRGDLFDRLLL